MAKKDPNSPYHSKEDIAKLAYAIFEREGRPHGRSLEHWFQAESLLLTALQPESEKAAANKKITKSNSSR